MSALHPHRIPSIHRPAIFFLNFKKKFAPWPQHIPIIYSILFLKIDFFCIATTHTGTGAYGMVKVVLYTYQDRTQKLFKIG